MTYSDKCVGAVAARTCSEVSVWSSEQSRDLLQIPTSQISLSSSCSLMTCAGSLKTSPGLGVWSWSCCGHSKKGHVHGGGCKTATMEVGALHVLTSNGLFLLGKIEQDRTRRINDKRGEIQPVFSSLSVGIGTPLMWKCRSELAKP